LFLNYRGKDSGSASVFLEKCLIDAFGPGSVFLDHQSIPLGHEFGPVIQDAIRHCSALLAVIGEGWLDDRLIDNPDDWVRQEIQTALDWNVLVVPVLIGEAPELTAADLPADLAILSRLQYARIRHRHQPQDTQDLINQLTTASPALRDTGRQPTDNTSQKTLIRDSRGIYVGDHGTQHNHF
jgi:hypothetical protein